MSKRALPEKGCEKYANLEKILRDPWHMQIQTSSESTCDRAHWGYLISMYFKWRIVLLDKTSRVRNCRQRGKNPHVWKIPDQISIPGKWKQSRTCTI